MVYIRKRAPSINQSGQVIGPLLSAPGKTAQRIVGEVNAWRLVSELIDAMRTEGYKCPKL
jgi:hypothetical protein